MLSLNLLEFKILYYNRKENPVSQIRNRIFPNCNSILMAFISLPEYTENNLYMYKNINIYYMGGKTP